MEQFKHYLLKFKWLIIAIIAIIIVATIITLVVKNKAIDVKGDVDVEFSGYDKSGNAALTEGSEEKIERKLLVQALKQSKFKNKEVIDMIKNGDEDDIDPMNFNNEEQKKLEKAEKIYDSVELDTYNDSNLSNGDKTTVKLSVKKGISDDYKLKVKEFKKSFKAKGLKKPKTVTTKDIFSNIETKFTGLNNSGKLNLITKNDESDGYDISSYNFTVPNNGNLKNGDKINLELPKELISNIQDSGSKTFKGSKTYQVEVKDLPDVNDIDNINDIIDKTKTQIKEDNKSTKYDKKSTEILSSYYKIGSEEDEYSFGYEEDDNESEKVTPTSTLEPDKYTILTTAKITDNNKYSDDTTRYKGYGYKNYTLEGKRLIKDESTAEITNNLTNEKQEDLVNELKSENFVKVETKK